MFKVGDIIKGKPASDRNWFWTNSRMTKGEVVEVIGSLLRIRIIEHENRDAIGQCLTVDGGNDSKYFELVKPEIKRKRTLRPIPMK